MASQAAKIISAEQEASGHGCTGCENYLGRKRKGMASQAAKIISAEQEASGHGFSRAANTTK
jgi:hypothetical protein